MTAEELGTLTGATREQIARMCYSVKEAQDHFLTCYRAGLADIAGPKWERGWKDWTEPKLAAVVRKLHHEMRAACVSAGMSPGVWKRYQRAAVNCVFIGIPFNFGTRIITQEINQVRKLIATKYTTGTEEERVREAVKELQRKRNEKTARSLLRNRTILAEPLETDDLPGELADQLTAYFARDDVLAEADPQAVLKQVQAALRQRAARR